MEKVLQENLEKNLKANKIYMICFQLIVSLDSVSMFSTLLFITI